VPIPEGLTPHSLRHTYISLRVALGDDAATIAQDAGHADRAVTFRIYTHVMRLQEGDRERLRALVNGFGTKRHWSGCRRAVGARGQRARERRNPRGMRGFLEIAGGRLELPTSRL
jgi:hypothetical protein